MADFKIKNGEQVRTIMASIASATVIAPGRLVELDVGKLVIDGLATGAALAYTPSGSAAGETEIEITVGNDFTLVGTADAAFAATDKGVTHDMIVTAGVQLIDIGAVVTNVLKIGAASTSGTVGATTNVEFKINNPIF